MQWRRSPRTGDWNFEDIVIATRKRARCLGRKKSRWQESCRRRVADAFAVAPPRHHKREHGNVEEGRGGEEGVTEAVLLTVSLLLSDPSLADAPPDDCQQYQHRWWLRSNPAC